MSRRILALVVLTVAVTLSFAGCQSLGKEAAMGSKVVPGPDERVIVDHVIVVVDASGSMYLPNSFPYAKELTRSFVSAMPCGAYDAGLVSYGGEWTNEWLDYGPDTFNRDVLLGQAAQLKLLGGSTPLADALATLGPDLMGQRGNGAVVIFSDGKTDSSAVLDACSQLLSSHLGQLCFYTVQVGCDCAGGTLLQNIAAVSQCGSARKGDDIATVEGMDDFVREVFFGGDRDSDGDGVLDAQDECPCTPRGAKVNKRGCWVLAGLNFDTDKAVIKASGKAILDKAAKVLTENPGVKVRVDGHTDTRASEDYNLGLSQRRAAAVRDALVARGIEAARLSTMGFGESDPMAPNNNARNMAKNRRVELTVVK